MMTINSDRYVTGVYDYDVFGAMNRESAQADTAHPYTENQGTSSTYSNTNYIADFTQAPASSRLDIDMLLRFHVVDTEGTATAPVDYAMVKDGTTGSCLDAGLGAGPKVGGYRVGAPVTAWMNTSAGHIQVPFYSNGSNNCPDGGVCQASCSASCATGVGFPYTGVSLEWAEYREYQSGVGVTPLALPLRFPGQYYDAESDLAENWNRYYDPQLGRYLETEPLWQAPLAAIGGAATATQWPMYAYAAQCHQRLLLHGVAGNQRRAPALAEGGE
jgi:RHS repeat-associated protein